MIDALGIIFTDGFDVELDEITERRTVASIPFGGRYRLIDFPLSAMANAGLRNIGIITKKNYQSLMDHIRGGAEWDLNLRSTGLTFLAPFSTLVSSEPEIYRNRLDGLKANIPFIKYRNEKYVLLMGSEFVMNEDLEDFFKSHVESGARVSIMCTAASLPKTTDTDSTYIDVDASGKVTKQYISSTRPAGSRRSLNAYIMERKDLLNILENAVKTGKKSLRRDILSQLVENGEAHAYEAKGKILHIDSMESYLKCSLELLNRDTRVALFANEDRPVLTHIMDSAPTKYGKNAKVSNSIIGDGAIIEGEVRNCIIFRNVKIEEGAVVENSVIMNDTLVSKGARLGYCVMDKDVIIGDSRWLYGYITHPFYSKRGSVI